MPNFNKILWILCLFFTLAGGVTVEEELAEEIEADEEHTTTRYQIASIQWHHVQGPFIICVWILLACLAKIVFNLSKKFSSIFPDSSLLIIVGLIVGIILFISNQSRESFVLTNNVFMIFLLPPIVFDAGYFMPTRAFFTNLGTILVYAVIGTLWNAAAIGISLWAVSLAGVFSKETPLLHILLFSSLISAVDPVAVIVVFEEIHINELLFIVVFGESLLNDAVTVVLYNMFESFAEIGGENLIPQDYVFGLISFFVISLGGILVGLIWAAIISLCTRFTKRVAVLEPLLIILVAYFSYLTAELFHVSGILAIVTCGMAMKQYVELNVSESSRTTVSNVVKMISVSCETIIFMFLGLSTASTSHLWDTAFIGLTVLFCLVYRAIGVVILTYFVNKMRLEKLTKVDQFIMAYGGLRGAIAYGLVEALSPNVVPAKQMFLTATIVVIYFTVFLQGMTIKPLVNFLKVKRQEHRDTTMIEHLFERLFQHTTAGVEMICAQSGRNALFSKYEHNNNKILKPLFLRDYKKKVDAGIVEVYTKLSMKEAMDMWRAGKKVTVARGGKPSIRWFTDEEMERLKSTGSLMEPEVIFSGPDEGGSRRRKYTKEQKLKFFKQRSKSHAADWNPRLPSISDSADVEPKSPTVDFKL